MLRNTPKGGLLQKTETESVLPLKKAERKAAVQRRTPQEIKNSIGIGLLSMFFLNLCL